MEGGKQQRGKGNKEQTQKAREQKSEDLLAKDQHDDSKIRQSERKIRDAGDNLK